MVSHDRDLERGPRNTDRPKDLQSDVEMQLSTIKGVSWPGLASKSKFLKRVLEGPLTRVRKVHRLFLHFPIPDSAR